MVLLKLLIVHILFDFFLQSERQVEEKKKLNIKTIIVHSFFHGVFSFIVILDIKFLLFAVAIFISHLIIDVLKNLFHKKKPKFNELWLVIIDQLVHIILLIVIYVIYLDIAVNWGSIFSLENILLFLCILLITKPSSIVVKLFLSLFDFGKSLDKDGQLKDHKKEEYNSLEAAGTWIGILERILIFIFIIGNSWSAIGLILAAKSVFRFGDLSKPEHRVKTEYVLLGSMMSFLIVIIVGLFYLNFQNIDLVGSKSRNSHIEKEIKKDLQVIPKDTTVIKLQSDTANDKDSLLHSHH